jgi:hypothetical protein
MRQLRTKRGGTAAPDGDLLELGRDLERLRRRCHRLQRRKEQHWAEWSAAVAETTILARRVGRLEPRSLDGLRVRYGALAWMLVEADDVIVDVVARRAFIAFGRAVQQLAKR